MREPIKPEDIREGDLIRMEWTREDCAHEYRAARDGDAMAHRYTNGTQTVLAGADRWFLLDRPKTVTEQWDEAARVCYSDECAEPCKSYTARLRDENAELRRQNAMVGDRLGEARRTIEAFIRETKLRKQVEICREWDAEDMVPVPKVQITSLRNFLQVVRTHHPSRQIIVDFLKAVDAANGDPR